ncbi:hypothetical protein [Halalkalibacter hemicellulosilyticus]|uniref:Uncharacterized protein n=1 Tax=Halalkalibacter hemicellulosilyticusJCM 9152 TaxID=1236971 RepID=W4QDI3_9BACI|nr:hypothetical protein [Halalkalibacter hemicellulosilyticus]GAE29748.1 hypothetical protein JCM9152_1128 [Halalkalibacter hemicellulosilyticusJCM 9152]
MIDIRRTFLCTQVNFRKWMINPRIYVVFTLTIAFLAYHSFGLSQFSAEVGYPVSPWIFAHLTTPPVMQVFAFLIILLFCDAPFKDRHTPFLIVRTGRGNWIIGQIFYIFIAAFIYTLFSFLSSIVIMIPNVEMTFEWGILLQTLANDPMYAPDSVTIFFNPEWMAILSPIEATLLSLLHFWFVAIFIGLVILSFNLLADKMLGILISGIFVFLSFFSVYIGTLLFGIGIYYFSPISWMSLSYVDWSYSGSFPSPTFALVTLLIAMIIMSIVSILIFIQKDIDIQSRRY